MNIGKTLTIVAAGMIVTSAVAVGGIFTVTPAFAEGEEKVTICHRPPGNTANQHEITVGAPAAAHHVDEHGDRVHGDDDKKCN
jgi:hypothetical protein